DDGVAYAERVVARKIPAPKLVRIACQRFLNDMALAESGRGFWRFDPEKARGPVLVAEGLPNIKGPFAGQDIVLLDWQRCCTINLFGFVERESGLRRSGKARSGCRAAMVRAPGWRRWRSTVPLPRARAAPTPTPRR